MVESYWTQRDKLEYHRTQVLGHNGQGNIRTRRALPHDEYQAPLDLLLGLVRPGPVGLDAKRKEVARPTTPHTTNLSPVEQLNYAKQTKKDFIMLTLTWIHQSYLTRPFTMKDTTRRDLQR